MARPEILRPIWVLEGDKSAVQRALSLTCSATEAADLVAVLRGLTGMSAEQRDRAEIMIPAFVAKLTDYPPLIASEVVHGWCETEEYFPRSWSLLRDQLDMVRRSLEALAR